MSLKYAILGMLSEEPRYGYEIKQEIEDRLGDMWPVSYGQLYPTFRKLLADEMVMMETQTGKKAIDKNVYSITEYGKEVFGKWLKDLNKKSQFSIKDEFTLGFMFFNRIDEETGRNILDNYNKSLENQIKKYQKFRNNKSEDPVSRIFSRKMLLHLEAEKTWLRELYKNFGTEAGETFSS